MPGILEGRRTQCGRVGGVGVDAGALDAAFPLVAVDIARERRGERQHQQAKGQRARQDDEQGGGARHKPLDQVDPGEVKYPRPERESDEFRNAGLKVGLAGKIVVDRCEAASQHQQAQGRKAVQQGR